MVFYVREVLLSSLQAKQAVSLMFKPKKVTCKTGKTNCSA